MFRTKLDTFANNKKKREGENKERKVNESVKERFEWT